MEQTQTPNTLNTEHPRKHIGALLFINYILQVSRTYFIFSSIFIYIFIYIFTKTQKLGMTDRLFRPSAVYEVMTVVSCIKIQN